MTIGVFDSGVGGLSVLREIRALLRDVDLVYVADSGHCPYGTKSHAEIRARAEAITRFLVLDQQAHTVVVACNTATVAAIDRLRERYPELPIVGMEPGVKPAVAATRTGVVGVLATGATLGGERFAGLVERFADGTELLTQACPGLVECVEAGALDAPETRELVARYVRPLLARGADTLVLGCTHYPFLLPVIRDVAGSEVRIIDTGPAVARQVERVAEHARAQEPTTRFFSSDLSVARVISALWGTPVEVQALPV